MTSLPFGRAKCETVGGAGEGKDGTGDGGGGVASRSGGGDDDNAELAGEAASSLPILDNDEVEDDLDIDFVMVSLEGRPVWMEEGQLCCCERIESDFGSPPPRACSWATVVFAPHSAFCILHPATRPSHPLLSAVACISAFHLTAVMHVEQADCMRNAKRIEELTSRDYR